MALLRTIPACPPEFAAEFIAGGWRRVERIYNARTDLLLKWIEMSGGDDLYRRRREHLRTRAMVGIGHGGKGVRPRGVRIAGWLDR